MATEPKGKTDPEFRGLSRKIRKMVVIIDQEVMYRGHLRELIEQEGFDPVTFSDAYQMLRHIEENREKIKAVFIDSAIFAAIEETVASMISSGNSRVRLILTDTELPRERIRQSIGRGVYGHVQKPYSEDEIAAFLH